MKDDRSYKTKKLVINSLLLSIGFLLHYFMPALGLPMQIDLSLVTLILIINLNKDCFGTCLASGIAVGLLCGITSKFPMGLVPNIIDKIVTTIVVFALVKLLDKTALHHKVKAIVINAVGTMVSGTIFLVSALLLVGLPAPFGILFVTIVLPTVVANTVIGFIVSGIFEKHWR